MYVCAGVCAVAFIGARPSTFAVPLLRGVASVVHSSKHQQVQNKQRAANSDSETQGGGIRKLAEVLLVVREHLATRNILQQASDVTSVGVDEQSGSLCLMCLGGSDEVGGCWCGRRRQEVAGQIARTRRAGVSVSLTVVRQLVEGRVWPVA